MVTESNVRRMNLKSCACRLIMKCQEASLFVAGGRSLGTKPYYSITQVYGYYLNIKGHQSLTLRLEGTVQIRKSRALKICPLSELARYVFAPIAFGLTHGGMVFAA